MPRFPFPSFSLVPFSVKKKKKQLSIDLPSACGRRARCHSLARAGPDRYPPCVCVAPSSSLSYPPPCIDIDYTTLGVVVVEQRQLTSLVLPSHSPHPPDHFLFGFFFLPSCLILIFIYIFPIPARGGRPASQTDRLSALLSAIVICAFGSPSM